MNRLRNSISRGGGVAIAGLATLLAVVAFGILSLPTDTTKAQNIVAIVTAAFGVIGAIVGAYFGISSANEARRDLQERLDESKP